MAMVPVTPAQPLGSRERSDTILTTSSGSSSSAYIQTPETPSILGHIPSPFVLSDHASGRPESSSLSEVSVDHGGKGKESSVPQRAHRRLMGSLDEASMRFFMQDAEEADEDSAAALSSGMPGPLLSPSPNSTAGLRDAGVMAREHGSSTGRTANNADPLPATPSSAPALSYPFPPMPSVSDNRPHGPAASTDLPETSASRSGSIKASFRRKLERSKSSFHSISLLSRRNSTSYQAVEDAGEEAADGDQARPKIGRLKSLLTKNRSRASSVSSVPATDPPPAIVPPNPQDRVEDAMHLYMAVHLGTRPGTRRYTELQRAGLMPSPSQPVVASQAITTHSQRLNIVDMLDPVGQVNLSPIKEDLWRKMLPREIQLRILKTVLQNWAESPGQQRFDGIVGGRRELIKLSRVSRSWRSLCLDGQLWSTCDLQPFASVLSPDAFKSLVTSIAPFIKTFSLRGLDGLAGERLVWCVIENRLPSLTSLDLRGCRSLRDDHICDILAAAPALNSLNLKGVQGTSWAVLEALALSNHYLEVLDISRCWSLRISDIEAYLDDITDSQAERLRTLRIAGIRSSKGTDCKALMTLIAKRCHGLVELNMLACPDLYDGDFEAWRKALEVEKTASPLERLVISGCSALTLQIFDLLTDMLPNVVDLEMADLSLWPATANPANSTAAPLLRLLRSIPQIERLDLEGTGENGGITDAVLKEIRGASGYGRGCPKLRELRLGFAKGLTNGAICKLVRDCPNLTTLDVDDTDASNALVQMWTARHRHDPYTNLSVLDCPRVSAPLELFDCPPTQPRRAWCGYEASPFGYKREEYHRELCLRPHHRLDHTVPQQQGTQVVKTFENWRRIGVADDWRTERARNDAQTGRRKSVQPVGPECGARGWRRLSQSWSRSDERDETDEFDGCVIM